MVTDWSPALPRPLVGSPLLRRGGYAVMDGLIDETTRRAFLEEAARCYPAARESAVAVSEPVEGRGGNPARRFLSAPGGPLQDAFFQATWLRATLWELVGLPVEPSSQRGTFTYYVRPGDHLALHRDVETCDLAVVTCLHDSLGPSAAGGTLRLYPSRWVELLAAIRASPEQGAVGIRLRPGQTIAMLGGIVPHDVLPVAADHQRIVSVLCYRILV